MGTEIAAGCPDGWEERGKPLSWTRRFSFPDYAATRSFLDRLTELSEEFDYYPNLNFARDYVVVAVQFDGDQMDARLAEYAHAAQAAYAAAE
ncbi:hypothetical protein HFU84_09975 [Acidithiobacillus sp. CV18-2]|uniref:4a-hydroxytetrahydrobiopterin dehydratase n=1 Tax=Igneacidithiobacillus copahuensis TaxID=2724909 RepID=A0AAE2YRY5_9PROT|nr:4a-hydroxytetrahydrobiopterin dehydratase [Igneacidithiobacillus copahuensis]MBU2754126.1 hypothetical protein [Acidithiobacillus sp. CV18-3]MBU2757003.1 hypothetical protein [Acidithiobacillus sp. BN09-2]MBU2777827.1 hypothetical protein [Acidithiobacillus sp. CV18-2]MBU2795574.1 hypothetical protein [Acidithiobacillus sp. VAN18-2]MBU2798802.1 hypothetical protein [Acidithiobacillus sp. VAN18-4]UTV81795.1 4a-hydroxytetrahydrobiopterin dehydratase [Acidithiobacillus sp. YTS05]